MITHYADDVNKSDKNQASPQWDIAILIKQTSIEANGLMKEKEKKWQTHNNNKRSEQKKKLLQFSFAEIR